MGTREIFNFQSPIFNFQFFLCLLPLLLLAGCKGCRESTTIARDELTEEVVSGQYHEELLNYAIDNLNRLEEFSSPDLFGQIIERLDPRNQPKSGQTDANFDSLLASWPEPEMLRQVVDRINQWTLTQQPPAGWKPDPMVGRCCPSRYGNCRKSRTSTAWSSRDSTAMRCKKPCGFGTFDLGGGDVMDDLERAKRLFDWTVRNIELEPDDRTWIPQFPWETLLFGRGTAAERAWVFILLLRQLNIDAAVLAVDKEPAARDEGQAARSRGKGRKTPLDRDPGGRAPIAAPAPLVCRRVDRGQRLSVRSVAGPADSRPQRCDA